MNGQLSPLEARILDVLREHGAWVGRRNIAALMGRTAGITGNDVKALERLEERGLIEKRETPIGLALKMFEYRALGGVG